MNMNTYFDAIPDDVIVIILGKITNESDYISLATVIKSRIVNSDIPERFRYPVKYEGGKTVGRYSHVRRLPMVPKYAVEGRYRISYCINHNGKMDGIYECRLITKRGDILVSKSNWANGRQHGIEYWYNSLGEVLIKFTYIYDKLISQE